MCDDYLRVEAHQTDRWRSTKARYEERAKVPGFQLLHCGKCEQHPSDETLLGINAVFKRQDVPLLCIRADAFVLSSPNQQSRCFWRLDCLKAYPERRRLPAEDNCKLTSRLKAELKYAMSGAEIASYHGLGYCPQGNHGESFEVLMEIPDPFQDLFHKEIPTPEGSVYLQPKRDSTTIFALQLTRSKCPGCQ